MTTVDERNIDPIAEMSRIAQDVLALSSRGFKESYRSVQHAKLIYNSDWCRISLVWGGWDYGTGNTMHIFYGRLHASNVDTTMLRNEEVCYCWHEFDNILHFLDGRTPAEAAKLKYSHELIDPFYEDELSQKYNSQPDWLAQMHVTIWDHYGQRLFDLFDLRQTFLWQRYEQFLKEVYDIAGRKPSFGPAKDKVC